MCQRSLYEFIFKPLCVQEFTEGGDCVLEQGAATETQAQVNQGMAADTPRHDIGTVRVKQRIDRKRKNINKWLHRIKQSRFVPSVPHYYV